MRYSEAQRLIREYRTYPQCQSDLLFDLVMKSKKDADPHATLTAGELAYGLHSAVFSCPDDSLYQRLELLITDLERLQIKTSRDDELTDLCLYLNVACRRLATLLPLATR